MLNYAWVLLGSCFIFDYIKFTYDKQWEVVLTVITGVILIIGGIIGIINKVRKSKRVGFRKLLDTFKDGAE